MTRSLSVADLRFVNRVAARRFASSAPGDVDDDAIAGALAATAGATPFRRAASLVSNLVQQHTFPNAPLQTALLVLHCALAFEGLSLLAPQGVAAGMIRELAAGGDPATMARWLEDRAVPAAGG